MAASLDAATLRRGMELFAQSLHEHRDELNSLNVFPVPDGDTGSNLVLTQEAVVTAVASLDGSGDVRELAEAISRASLRGARGNSGVILSQILRGLCERLPADGPAGGGDLAAGLRHASVQADLAVARPKEGTILSVLREAASAAEAAADAAGDVDAVARGALDAARRSLERTRGILPELRRAGVVDAGAKGLVLLLDALAAAIEGRALSEPLGELGPVGSEGSELDTGPDFEFEVQFLLEGPEDHVANVRRDLTALGGSVVVVGGGGLFNVHVHTDDPREAFEVGERAGRVRDGTTVSLRDQVGGCIGGQARGVQIASRRSGMVAAADGPGLEAVFRSLGAVVVSSSAPGTDDFARAVEEAGAEAVLLIPNDPAALDVAERLAAAGPVAILIVPAVSIAAGLAAAAAFDPLAGPDANEADMSKAAAAVRVGQVSPTGHSGWQAGLGDAVLGVFRSAREAGRHVAERLLDGHPTELITVIVGARADDPDAVVADVRAAARSASVDAEVHVIDGGQPEPSYVISAE